MRVLLTEDIKKNFSWLDMVRAMWYFLEEKRLNYAIWTLILFTVTFYQMIPALIIAHIINFFAAYHPGQSLNEFYFWAVFLGASAGIAGLIRLTGKNKLGDLQSHARYIARTKGFERLVDFSVIWHDKENTGNKVQRIQTGNSAMGSLQQLVQSDLFTVATAFIGVFIAFFFMYPVFIFFMSMYLCGFFLIQARFYRKLVAMQEENNKLNEQASGSFFEGVNNILTIKTLGAQHSFKSSIIEREKLARDMSIKMRKTGINKWKTFQLFNGFSTIIYLLLVGHGVISGVISIGAIYVYGTYLAKLIDASSSSTDIFDQLVEYRSALGRMMPIFWQTEIATQGNKRFPKNWQDISIQDGVFNYKVAANPDNLQASNKFSLHLDDFGIRKNSRIGIVGHSGSGKSTLAKILLGLYSLQSGTFAVDTVPYSDIAHEEITKYVTIVLQDSEMFNLSLRENITLMKDVSSELFERAVQVAQLEEIIGKLPEGINTLIGEKGYRLSGGERQRVGIARAICKNSPIMVFDEATSSLDTKTEQLIQSGIEKELGQKTLLLIAHRLSTLKNVDYIYVFDHGKIVESGLYQHLVQDPKTLFAKMYKVQQVALKKTKV